MYFHIRVPAFLWDQQRPDALFNLDSKTYESYLESEILPCFFEPPFIEGLKGFPGKLVGDMCWQGSTLGSDPSSYMVNFGPEDVNEFEVATHRFKGRWSVALASQNIQLTHEQS